MIQTMRHPCSKPGASCRICQTIKLLVFVCALLCGQVFAQQLDNNPPVEGFSVHLGQNGDLQRVAAVYETPVWWRYPLGHNGARVDLNGELEISYWISGDREPNHLWQFGFTPMFRWWPSDTFYVEAGVGATVLNRTRFAGRDLSTAFQFGSHMGMGVLIDGRHKIALRISHFSNADIKTPNPGLNLIELAYTYQF